MDRWTYTYSTLAAPGTRHACLMTPPASETLGIRKTEEKVGTVKKGKLWTAMSYARLDGPNIRAQCRQPFHEHPTRRLQGREE